jgi:hypothetical protein
VDTWRSFGVSYEPAQDDDGLSVCLVAFAGAGIQVLHTFDSPLRRSVDPGDRGVVQHLEMGVTPVRKEIIEGDLS